MNDIFKGESLVFVAFPLDIKYIMGDKENYAFLLSKTVRKNKRI
jgi:hypothetical protein